MMRAAPAVFLAGTLVAGALVALRAGEDDATRRRLQSLQQETARLKREMESLAGRERGLLGEMARLDAEIAFERARLEEASVGLQSTQARFEARERACGQLEGELAERAPLAAQRIRALYEHGEASLLPRLVLPAEDVTGLDGLRYASYLARRDARQIADWRATSLRLKGEQSSLTTERQHLAAERDEASRSAAALDRARLEREALLNRIRNDREQRQAAIGELDAAAASLARVVEALDDQASPVALDVRKFRGLLDWPSEGKVTATFGNVIHPRFKTELPHPGLDIDASEGSSFRAVFDGRVAFAAPLHGYGLTVVVDHGNGVATVYAHAGVLVVEPGDAVVRGQPLGQVGDSGSLRGPYLYFELRVAGKPEDPANWLRQR
jgi:septal ring factor EnvC (AmiA/AmiB activator)